MLPEFVPIPESPQLVKIFCSSCDFSAIFSVSARTPSIPLKDYSQKHKAGHPECNGQLKTMPVPNSINLS